MIRVSNEKTKPISEGMFGLFFEDINYALDGGLHAEMIENRNFEFFDCGGNKCNWYKRYDGLYGYSTLPANRLRIDTEKPQNEVNPHYLRFTGTYDGAYFCNKAYDGIFMEKGKKYRVSMYIKAEDYDGRISVSVRKREDGEALVTAVIAQGSNEDPLAPIGNGAGISGEWKRFFTVLEAQQDIEYGKFCVELSKKGEVCFDFISMYPADAVCGVFRPDLADKLKSLKPGFLRFPGGCVVEGNTLDNMYKWKLSVGEPEKRKLNWNRWAVHQNNGHGPFSHYNQTLGVGYFEYFELCEYIGAQPLPVCNVGMACQYESNEFIELEDDHFKVFIQDALDLIEFANGRTDTKWGSLRAQMGHRDPFGLKLLGIGNEQWDTPESRFFKRYSMFEAAIHSKYPDIKLIGSAGPNVKSPTYDSAWEFYRGRAKENNNFAYAIDEHYYVSPQWMTENAHFYDDYPRDVKVFAGEYAAHIGPDLKDYTRNCVKAAVSEAAFMTGLERNSDVVVMASYAPLLARAGYTQWAPDLIWFDAKSSFMTPNAYVQKFFSTMTGSIGLKAECEDERLFVSASLDEKSGKAFVKVVNPSEEDIISEFEPGKEELSAEVTVLSGNGWEFNSIEQPEKIVPKTHEELLKAGGRYSFPAMSVTIFAIQL